MALPKIYRIMITSIKQVKHPFDLDLDLDISDNSFIKHDLISLPILIIEYY